MPEDSGASATSMPAYWASHRLTGDNLKERIYTTLYPRVTTKSNVFTVHYRVQTLKQVNRGGATSNDWYGWDEKRDQVISEKRGSVTIERYIDPNDAAFNDFATNPGLTLDDRYRFRVIDSKRFSR